MTEIQHNRKPRIVIAGEFSAGKTQLINGLLGENVLPSNVTSTSLPPVWISADHTVNTVVSLKGARTEMGPLESLPVEQCAFCQLKVDAPFLETVDVIDTPGNSDPNIPAESWMRMLDYADAVVWCTNAVQAWRQSEKAVWQAMPEALRKKATLLITHADRLIDEGAPEKLLRRVKRDASEFFENIQLVSLLDDDDLKSVSDHLLDVAGQAALIGAEPQLGEVMKPVRPRRRGEADAADVQADLAASGVGAAHDAVAEQPVTEPAAEAPRPRMIAPRMVNVVRLFDADRQNDSKAAHIWSEVSADRDLKTVADWQACVRDFLGALEQAFDATDALEDVRHGKR